MSKSKGSYKKASNNELAKKATSFDAFTNFNERINIQRVNRVQASSSPISLVHKSLIVILMLSTFGCLVLINIFAIANPADHYIFSLSLAALDMIIATLYGSVIIDYIKENRKSRNNQRW